MSDVEIQSLLISQAITVLGTLGGTVLGYYSTKFTSRDQYRLQRKIEIDRRRLENLERVHLAISAKQSAANQLNLKLLSVYDPKQSAAVNLDFDPSVKNDTLNLLADFYVPELQSEITALNESFHALAGFLLKATGTNASAEKNKHIEEGFKAFLLVGRQANDAKLKLAGLVRTLLNGD